MKKGQTKGAYAPAAGSGSKERIRKIGKGTSDIVQYAAELLDEELAAGIVAAKQAQQRFAREGKIDPKDFQATLQKFQSDSHEIIEQLGERLTEFRTDPGSTALIQKFLGKSHELLDLTVDMVGAGAEVANQLIAKNLKQGKPGDGRKSGG